MRLKEKSDPIEHHLKWLLFGPARLPGGLCAAWVDGDAASYGYQESTGYLLSLLCFLFHHTGEERYFQQAAQVAGALAGSVGHSPGCGREGVTYLFDTSVCLRALTLFLSTFHKNAGGETYDDLRTLQHRLADTAKGLVVDESALIADALAPAKPRWSETFNVHLIKAVHHCLPWLTGSHVINRITDRIDRRYRDGFFHLDDELRAVYVHAHCYALEGLIALEEPRFASLLEESALRLTQAQTENGGMPRFLPAEPNPEEASDATAQAVRIWQCLDPLRYEESIRRGLAFLKTMAHPGGGIRYSSRSHHLNSWATIFTVQALAWQNGQGEAAWLI